MTDHPQYAMWRDEERRGVATMLVDYEVAEFLAARMHEPIGRAVWYAPPPRFVWWGRPWRVPAWIL